MWRFCVLVLVALLTAAMPCCGAGDPPFPYHVTTIDLPVPTESLTVRAVTDSGDVLGTYSDRHGRVESFRRVDGRLTLHPLLQLAGLADGALVGTFGGDFGPLVGVLFADGALTFLRVPLPDGTRLPTAVHGLNAARQVVGEYTDAAGVAHGFVYDLTSNAYTTIEAPFPVDLLSATGINAAGHIVGFYRQSGAGFLGFLKVDNTVTPLDVPGAVGGTIAWGLNDTDVVVGTATLELSGLAGVRGFVYTGGAYTLIQVPGALATELYAISNNGTLGGRYLTADGVSHGVILTPKPARRH